MMPDPEVCNSFKLMCKIDIFFLFSLISEEDNREKGKLYKPQTKLDDKSPQVTDKNAEYAKMLSNDSKKDALKKGNKSQEKKKSNLELFKEELRQ